MGARESELFLQRTHTKKKTIFFRGRGGGAGLGVEAAGVSEFFSKNLNLK